MQYHNTINNNALYKNVKKSGYFKGYAARFNIQDNHHDIILPGAFVNSLNASSDIKLLWQHDQTQPIGIISALQEDEIGLKVEGKLLLNITKAREAYSLIEHQAIKGLSIGYTVLDYHLGGGVRYLSKLKLHEISLVTFPANQHAQVDYIKQDGGYQELIYSIDKANKILVGDNGFEPTTSTMST